MKTVVLISLFHILLTSAVITQGNETKTVGSMRSETVVTSRSEVAARSTKLSSHLMKPADGSTREYKPRPVIVTSYGTGGSPGDEPVEEDSAAPKTTK